MPYTLVSDEEPITQEQPSFGSEVIRQVGRTGLRVAEQVAGFPGDILSLVNEFIARPIAKGISGQETSPYEELGISSFLPTSQQLRGQNIEQFGEKVKPQNKVEEFFDNLTSDATSVFLSAKKIKTAAELGKSAASSLVKSIGANVAKEIVKDYTADEKKAAYAHLGSLFLLSFIDKPGAARAISEGYRPLEQKVAQLAPVSAQQMQTNLTNLSNKVQKGTMAPSEKFVVDEINAVLSKIQNGMITPEEAWASKRSLNEKLSKVLFESPQKQTQARARKLANQISGELDSALEQTKKQDPTFYKELKGWNNAYKTLADSNFVSKWIENNLVYTPLTHGLLGIFGSPIGAIGAKIAIPYQAAKISYRIANSKKLANHYAKTVSAAIKEDLISFNRQLKSLDKEIQKDIKKDRYSFLED